MAIYDPHFGGYRIFIGDLGQRTSRFDIEKEYERYGKLVDVWVARNPPGFAFIVFKHLDECERAVRKSHGRELCGRRVRVEYARPFDDRSGKQVPAPSNSAKERSRSQSPTRRRSSRHTGSRDGHRHRHRSGDRGRRDHSDSRSRSRSRHRRNSGRTHHRTHHHKSTKYSRGRSRSSTRGRSSSPSHTEGIYAPISSRSQHSHSDTECSDDEREGSYPDSAAELTIKDSV